MREHLNAFAKLELDRVRKHILRYAVTDLGREHIEKLCPSSNYEQVTHQLALVSEMKRLMISEDPLPLDAITDVRVSIQRTTIDNFSLGPEDLAAIARALKNSRAIKTYFARRGDQYPLLFQIVNGIQPDKVLEYNIDQAIDDEGVVRDSASKELSSIRKQLSERSGSLRRHLEKILKNVAGNDWIQEEIITTRDGRMVIPIKTEHKNRVPGFMHSASASGATVFIEPTETLDLNNEIRTLQFQERREIELILRELTSQVAKSKDLILSNLRVYGEIDFVQAKSSFSIEILGSEPKMKIDGAIKLIEAYHPVLLQHHPRNEIVPLNLTIGENLRTIVITGPNAGGKSVTMKTVGLMAVLAQSGCHIPASPESELSILSNIFIEMGDDQSIENDLSSFSSHLSNLKYIVLNADSSSLILIDEIGSGTDPGEGACIAASILEHLTRVKAITIVTTHHGVLKSFAYERAGMENGAMEFNQETLIPTYKYKSGVPGSSYALEMAERLELPIPILERAKTLRGSDSLKLENLIEDLERRTQELQSNLSIVNEEKIRYNSLNLIYESKLSALEKELKSVKLKAVTEAEHIVDRANVAIERAIREIKEQDASSSTIKSVRNDIQGIRDEYENLREELAVGPEEKHEFTIGDSVKLRESNSIGEIVAQIDKNHYLLLAGSVKMKVHKNRLLPGEKSRSSGIAVGNDNYGREAKRDLDLRGMYGNEAIEAIEKFFDEATLSGVMRVNLIHGKGTGALRRKINDYLKNHTSIKSYRLGEWNEGGSGVTVVELA